MNHPRDLFTALFLCLVLVAAGCSGSASSTSQPQPGVSAKPDTNSVGTTESIDHSSASQPRTVTEQPRAVASRPVSKAKPSRDIQRSEVARNETPAVATPAPPPAPPTLTLPAPVPPAVDAPVAPPEPIAVKSEPPAPVTRQMTVAKGTPVSIRMIDSVDSATAHVGETFKASLDSPIVVDYETVFPRGAEVYVKLTKVESAGRVSGKSELQLQLDRIFLGNKSYTLESNTFENTGASQGGRTARSAGIGAAIGAAIGAISGGGKGAVIGGATGAGAGAGVEAIRKGEQIRVDSETRLDFVLQNPVDVTIQLPSPSNSSPHRNLSGPDRFGTRH
jgi:LysM repeat protein